MLLWNLLQGSLQSFIQLVLFEDDICPISAGGKTSGTFLREFMLASPRKSEDASPLLSTELVESNIDGDAIEPSGECRVTSISPKSMVRFDENFLRQILNIGRSSNRVQEDVAHPLVVFGYQLVKSAAITTLEPLDELEVFVHRVAQNQRLDAPSPKKFMFAKPQSTQKANRNGSWLR
jgi:hypothetical protein